jgi:hypothetical protein
MPPPDADGADTTWFNTAGRYVKDGERVDQWHAGFARRLQDVARAGATNQLTVQERVFIDEHLVRPSFGALLEFLAWSIDEFNAGRVPLLDVYGRIAPERAVREHRRRFLLTWEVAKRTAELAEVLKFALAERSGKHLLRQHVPVPSPPWDDDPPAIG